MSFKAESSFEGEEVSIIDYARYHGLSYDPAHDDNDEFELNLVSAASSSLDNYDHDENAIFSLDKDWLDEKLTLDTDARNVLASIVQSQQFLETYHVDLDVRRTKYYRLEEPMLLTDPQLDIKQYLEARIAAQSEVVMDCNELSHLLTEERDDEGLGWSEKYENLPTQFWREIEDEKIQAPKESLIFLHQVCQPHNTQQDIYDAMDSELNYQGVLS